ncbi:hypothetical protein Sango_2355500 [Sesamum angolense]|uniref:Transcription initiation factor IIF subunit beta n=1 Tax=Sesamum angolense TaxID=2727404 RepID=A0AAE1W6B4_9LAMI|nr:hypothetical protein Sango_2355500 [Sesamum angolense]
MEDDHIKGNNTTVDSAKADRSIWLMKCPPVVSKAWQSSAASGDSPPLAKVVVSLDPLQSEDPSALQFTMEMAGNEVVNMPKSYSLNMFKDFVPMCVFSQTNQGESSLFAVFFFNLFSCFDEGGLASDLGNGWLGQVWHISHSVRTSKEIAVEGKMEHKFDMKPHHENIEEYKMCRERTNKSMIKNRQVQVINNDNGVHMRPMPGMMGFITSTSKDKKKAAPVKSSEVKRTRRDRGELEDIMFKLFERQPNWALKQLVQETDQPAQFLKEILNELCVYNKRGTNQGTYELKPEYKKSVADTSAV